MTHERSQQITLMVRRAIVGAIEDDLHGEEEIMRNVFDQMEDEAEFRICFAEMRNIIEKIQA